MAENALPVEGTQDVEMAAAQGNAAETEAPPMPTGAGLPGEGTVPEHGLPVEGTPPSSLGASWQQAEGSELGGATVERMTLEG